MLALLLLSTLVQAPATGRPLPVVDTAIARMGGLAALTRIERVRMEMMTQWQRTSFDERPYTDLPSYERHSDVRDYSIPAWRNTRTFVSGGAARPIIDIVRDSVAIRNLNGTWGPLNVAYVDERRELFAFAADRLMLAARAAADLKAAPDTTIGGIGHSRVTATIAGFPSTIFFRRTDGLPAMVRYRAAQANDFGLAPWGEMEVELWYSRWTRSAAGVALPTQWDVRRVGRPYKRITVLSMAFDTVATADSFAVSDSLRTAFLTTATRPMYDVAMDSARIVEDRFATFGTFGPPAGAVRLGTGWLLLEGGQAPLITERSVQWLEQKNQGTVTATVVTLPSGANGGLAWLAGRKIPIHTAPGARPFVRQILQNHRQPAAVATAIVRGQWLQLGGDSLWVEPIDYPDAQGSLYLYSPTLRWAYSAGAAGALQVEYLQAKLKARGWVADRIGSARGIAVPVPTPRADTRH
jgi:hypothetical protein